MIEDAELLRRYVESRSEADFAELVRRYLGLVYHAALRRTNGRRDLADDISQYVFLALARNARELMAHETLAGWLYTTTRIAVSRSLRAEGRRRARERDSQFMNDAASSQTDPEWNRVRAELDVLLDELPSKDREAVLLRYFQERPFAKIGLALGLSEEAARKRVDRAVERLRSRLLQRGITSTAGALGTLLTAEAGLAAPAALAKIITTASLTPAAGAGLTTLGILEIMSTTKSTLSIASALALAGLLGVSGVAIAVHEFREASRSLSATMAEEEALRADEERLRRIARETLAATERTAKLQAELDQTQAAADADAVKAKAAAAVSKTSPRDPAEDGRKFLAKFTEAKSRLMELGKAGLRRDYALFYHNAHLSASQIDAFETLKAQDQLDTVRLQWGSIVPGPSQLTEGQLNATLGEEGVRQYHDFERLEPAHSLALNIRANVAFLASPLSDAQEEELTQVIANSSSSYVKGEKADLRSVDWTTVMSLAKQALTAEQWEGAEMVLLRQKYDQALAHAQRGALASTPVPITGKAGGK